MKHGILFFLNMGKITTAARILLIPSFLFIWRTRPLSFAFYFLIVLCAVSFVLSFVPAPSDKRAQANIEKFNSEVILKMQEVCYIKNKDDIMLLKGYEKIGTMKMSRRLGKEVVYPHPVVLAFGMRKETPVLMIARRNLLKASATAYVFLELGDETKIAMGVENDGSIAKMTIHTDVLAAPLCLYTESTYHLKDFQNNLQPYLSR